MKQKDVERCFGEETLRLVTATGNVIQLKLDLIQLDSIIEYYPN